MNIPATLQNLEDLLHTAYEGDTETPAEGSDDWDYRLNLLNQAIRAWERQGGFEWPELYATNTATATDGTTTAFSLPANFDHMAGFAQVNINGTVTGYTVIPVNQAQLFADNTSDTVAYITGTPGAYTLNFTIAPDTGTLTLNYYKTATELTTAANTTECPDPDYLVFWALAELYKGDNNYAGYNSAKQEAESRINRLKTLSLSTPNFQPNSVYVGGASLGD